MKYLLPLCLVLLFSCKSKETTHTVVLTEWAEQRDSAMSIDSFNARVKRTYQQLKDSGIYFVAVDGGVQIDSSQTGYKPIFKLSDTSGYTNEMVDSFHWSRKVVVDHNKQKYAQSFAQPMKKRLKRIHHGYIRNVPFATIAGTASLNAPPLKVDYRSLMIFDSGRLVASRDTLGNWDIIDAPKALEMLYNYINHKQ